MADPTLPPRYLRTPEAARFLGLSHRTLEKHRTYGTGPTYRKIGGRVVYILAELEAWYLGRVVALHQGNLTRAAQALGVDRSTLRRRQRG